MFEILKIFFTSFAGIFNAIFSVFKSFNPFKELVSQINTAFSIVNVICYGTLTLLATALIFIRKHIFNCKK